MPEPTREPSAFVEVRTTACHAGSDGDCNWSECPQLRDGEPKATGRHCPLDSIAKVHAPSVPQPTREPEPERTARNLAERIRGRLICGAHDDKHAVTLSFAEAQQCVAALSAAPVAAPVASPATASLEPSSPDSFFPLRITAPLVQQAEAAVAAYSGFWFCQSRDDQSKTDAAADALHAAMVKLRDAIGPTAPVAAVPPVGAAPEEQGARDG